LGEGGEIEKKKMTSARVESKNLRYWGGKSRL